MNAHESFSHSLIASKLWLCEKLERVIDEQSIKNPISCVEVNVNGTLNILEAMKKVNISKLIFASSSSVYCNNKTIPFSESNIVDSPISPYAFSKKSVTQKSGIKKEDEEIFFKGAHPI